MTVMGGLLIRNIHGLLKRYLCSERYAALLHCAELEKLDLFTDSIIIFDRGYYSEDMFRYFADKGYQSNRAFIIGRIKWFLPRFVSGDFDISILKDIFEGACANRSQVQPDRKCKRNKKNSARERKHFNNRKQTV